ncbi:MAG: hypothetical protein HOE90_19560 [Bacteriovoracaceae bacterium]|jgi:dimethylargininase|nr:hypothetical protein [Bacteriovoracaceae bacterium]
MKQIFLREPSTSFDKALSMDGAVINKSRAKMQFEEYANFLKEGNREVKILPPITDYPDSCFIEDTALVYKNQALITNIGAKSRKGENELTRSVLEKNGIEITELPEGATLDGGDILINKNLAFIGISKRTNRAGFEAASEFLKQFKIITTPVKLTKFLHLKCICSSPTSDYIFATENISFLSPLYELEECIKIPLDEALAANIISNGNDFLIPAGNQKTLRILKERGLSVKTIDFSEFLKADGSLSCLHLKDYAIS